MILEWWLVRLALGAVIGFCIGLKAVAFPGRTSHYPLRKVFDIFVGHFSVGRHFVAVVMDCLKHQTVLGKVRIDRRSRLATLQKIFAVGQNQFAANLVSSTMT